MVKDAGIAQLVEHRTCNADVASSILAPGSTPPLFDLVLRLRSGLGLPLHIGRSVRAAAFQRLDMIDDVPGAARKFSGSRDTDGPFGTPPSPAGSGRFGRVSLARTSRTHSCSEAGAQRTSARRALTGASRAIAIRSASVP